MTGTLYLGWLFIVSLAFLYNGVSGPLRTAFKRAPIYTPNPNLFPVVPRPPTTDSNRSDDNSTFGNIQDTLNHTQDNDTGDNYSKNSFQGRRLLYALNSSDATPQNPLQLTENRLSTDSFSTLSDSFYTRNSSLYTKSNPHSTQSSSLTQTSERLASSRVTYQIDYYDNSSVFPINFSKNPILPAHNLQYSSNSPSGFSTLDIFQETGSQYENHTDSILENVTTTSPDESGIIGYFPGYETEENRIYWWIIDYICDLIYIIDIVFVKSRVTFLKNGIPEA